MMSSEYEMCMCPRCGEDVVAYAMTEGMCLKCADARPMTQFKFGEHEFEIPTEDVEVFKSVMTRMGVYYGGST